MRDRDPVTFVTQFSRALRDRGIPATPASAIDAVQALAAIDVTDKGDVYFALRSVLATRHQHFALFDRLFEDWWGSHNQEDGRDRTPGPRQPGSNPPLIGPWGAPKVATAST